MSDAKLLRIIVMSFENNSFTKDELKNKAEENGFSKDFNKYFRDLYVNGKSGVKIVDDGNGRYRYESYPKKPSSLKQNKKGAPHTKTISLDDCDFSKMIDNNEITHFSFLINNFKLDVAKQYIVKLNKYNSIKIESCLKKDASYHPYVKEFCRYYDFRFCRKIRYNQNLVVSLIRLIDWENNTQQWEKNRNGLLEMANFITKKENNFWSDVKNGKVGVVDKLAKIGKKDIETDTNGSKSLASKICKNISLYCFGKDNYYVNDFFVRKVLRYYYAYYLGKWIVNIDNASYEQLHGYLSTLHSSINVKKEKLSKHELDHILWYCYKTSKGTIL